VLGTIVKNEPDAIALIEKMLNNSSTNTDIAVSTFPTAAALDEGLISAMMPFSPDFKDIRDVIKSACASLGLKLQAADDIWVNSVIIEDIFKLIETSSIVIVDFTNKNPNVMYETGVAHALRKEVIPISQSLDDVPFDLKHHRVLLYENNTEGRKKLQTQLVDRIKTIYSQHEWFIMPF
jgi:nucleoside 2-deoxyribosyltransferase